MRPRVTGAALGALIALGVFGCGDSGDETQTVPEDVASAPAESFYLGEEFDGLPLTTVLAPPTGSGDSTSFIYGHCEPPAGEGGCAPPLEVQTWPLCGRAPQVPIKQLDHVRGALVESDPRESRVEVLTGESTVVIFGSAKRAAAAVDELRQRDDADALTSFEPPSLDDC